MAPSLLTQSVLAGKPAANCDAYIVGLLADLRKRLDDLRVAPGGFVVVPGAEFVELSRALSELTAATCNRINYAA